MQIIEKNYIVNGSLARLVDETLVEQGAEVIPTMTRGMQVQVRLNLYRDSDTPYTLAELGFPHWDFVLGHDYDTDPERSPVQVRASSVNVEASGDTDPRAVVVIELTETNTEELVAQLGSNEFKTFHGELVGMETVNGSPEFLIQFDVKVQNRVGAGGTLSPTPLPYSGYPDLPDETGRFILERTLNTDTDKLISAWIAAASDGGNGGNPSVLYIPYETTGTFIVPAGAEIILAHIHPNLDLTVDLSEVQRSMAIGQSILIAPIPTGSTFTDSSQIRLRFLQGGTGVYTGINTACVFYLADVGGTKGITFQWCSLSNISSVNNKIGRVTLTASDVGAAALSHTHTIAQVTNLQTTLNGKASTSHTHTIAQITSLQTNLNMLQSQITSLQSALAAKIDPAPSDGKLYGMKDGEWVEISQVSADSILMDDADQLVDNSDTLTDN